MKGQTLYSRAKDVHAQMYKHPNKLSQKRKETLYKKYFDLIKRAAYLGNTDAQYDLAQQYETMSYLYFENPIYNPRKCVYWYTKASHGNHPAACNNLASFYEIGAGVGKDLRKALALYKKAANLGYSLGKENYKILLRQVT